MNLFYYCMIKFLIIRLLMEIIEQLEIISVIIFILVQFYTGAVMLNTFDILDCIDNNIYKEIVNLFVDIYDIL